MIVRDEILYKILSTSFREYFVKEHQTLMSLENNPGNLVSRLLKVITELLNVFKNTL